MKRFDQNLNIGITFSSYNYTEERLAFMLEQSCNEFLAIERLRIEIKQWTHLNFPLLCGQG